MTIRDIAIAFGFTVDEASAKKSGRRSYKVKIVCNEGFGYNRHRHIAYADEQTG